MQIAAVEVDKCSATVHAGITCELVEGGLVDGELLNGVQIGAVHAEGQAA